MYIRPFIFCLIISLCSIAAQDRPEVVAIRTELTIKVDGLLDEPVWATIKPITEFVQRLPLDGGEPTEKSEMRILYDDNHLYFGLLFLIVNLKKFVRRFLIEVAGFIGMIS